jgi:hypothetical protein
MDLLPQERLPPTLVIFCSGLRSRSYGMYLFLQRRKISSCAGRLLLFKGDTQANAFQSLFVDVPTTDVFIDTSFERSL